MESKAGFCFRKVSTKQRRSFPVKNIDGQRTIWKPRDHWVVGTTLGKGSFFALGEKMLKGIERSKRSKATRESLVNLNSIKS